MRITLTLPTINRAAEELWLMATGTGKAQAVGMAFSGPDPVQLPAAGVAGMDRTLWMLDRAAAAQVPPVGSQPPLTTSPPPSRCTRPCTPANRGRWGTEYGRWATKIAARRGLALAAALAEAGHGFGEDGLTVGLAAALLHVGEVRLVGLDLGAGRGVGLVLACG